MRPHVPWRRRAYTLIEVLIVVSIIGFASAIVVPHIVSASTLGIQAATRSVIADLLYAQNEAIAQQRPRRVVIDTKNERYWLEDENHDKIKLQWRVGGGDGDLIDFTRDPRFRGVKLAGVNVDNDGNAAFTDDAGRLIFEFDELGGPTMTDQDGQTIAGDIGLMAGDQKFVIHVAPFTGRVTVKRSK